MRELIRLSRNQRFRQVFSLFVLFVVQFWWLNKVKRFLSPEETTKRYRKMYQRQAKKFTDTAIGLGGLLIKLGQFFSSRVDLLPQEYTDELAKLQDAVEPVATPIIRDRIQQELKAPIAEIFSSFEDRALAAASLGQVHRAALDDGTQVAVKVLRPGIEDIVGIDLETLKVIITFAKRYPRISNSMDLDKVYIEFRNTLSDELDYVKEAENAEWARECFHLDETVYVPKVYPDYSTSRVLTLEYVEGFKVNDYQTLDRAAVNRVELAKHLVDCFLRQVLVEGFYHADPHPGNLLVRPDGVLILLDFGMVGHVNRQMKASMVVLAVALFKKDAAGVVEAFDKLGFLRPHADRSSILKSVRLMMASLFGETLDLGKMDFTELSLELRELVYSQPFQIPAETTFLGKALITIFGLCNGLDPEFDLMKAVSPFIEDMFVAEEAEGITGQIFEQIKRTALEFVTVPEKVNRFIDGVETGEVRFQPSRGFEQRMLEHQTRLANRIVRGVLASGLIISGAQLMGTYYQWGVTLLVVGGAAALLLLAGGSAGTAVARRSGISPSRSRGPMGKMGSGFKKPRLHP